MKIYLAGTMGIKSRERKLQRRITHRLLSYWDISQNQFAVPYAFHLIKLKKSKKQKK